MFALIFFLNRNASNTALANVVGHLLKATRQARTHTHKALGSRYNRRRSMRESFGSAVRPRISFEAYRKGNSQDTITRGPTAWRPKSLGYRPC